MARRRRGSPRRSTHKQARRQRLQRRKIDPTQPAPSLSQASIDTILKRNLFNSDGEVEDTATEEKKGDEEKSAEVVKSDLPVKLLGTIYGGDPFSGIALVENETKKTVNSFMVGDILTKDATVKGEVHQERIIVDHNNRLEFIEVTTEGLNRSRRHSKKPASTEPTIAPIATAPPPDNYKEDGLERKGHDTVMTDVYRKRLLTTDFAKVLQDAKATPNMVDGELRGFESWTRIRQDSIYEKAGLKNDDIITEVNGVPLTDTAQAIRLLQSLRNESDIEVRILRGGSPQKFTLGIH